MVFVIVPAAKELMKIASILSRAEEKRRLSIAAYLDKIADCISSIADLAEQDRTSKTLHRLCSELDVYGDEASAAIRLAIGHAGDRVISYLDSAQDAPGRAIDGLLSSSVLETETSRRTSLRTLQEAAGHMRGVANTLRAPQVPLTFWKRLFRSKQAKVRQTRY